MTATLKTVVVLAGPSGPTGTIKGVKIFANVTGASGTFTKWLQATGATGPSGVLEKVYSVAAGDIASEHKTVIISGYVGFRADTTQIRADTARYTADYSR